MKKLMYWVALGVLTARANHLAAQSVTNGMVRWQVPTNNLAASLVAARSSVKQPGISKIAENTPAFEAFAVPAMLAAANEVREKWKLEGWEKPLTIDDIKFTLQARPRGLSGDIGTRDGPYSWGFNCDGMDYFADNRYRPLFFRYNDEEEMRLAKIKSQITAKEAVEIAREALRRLGMTEANLELVPKPEVNQYKVEDYDGVVYPLPCFNVVWRQKGMPRYLPGSNVRTASIEMDISGITKNVVNYHCFMRCTNWNGALYKGKPYSISTNSNQPHLPKPTNYWALLNLPTNYLDTLPPARRSMLGLPDLTNAPPDTNVIR